MKPSSLAAIGLFLIGCVSGCEHGTEIAGVGSATAARLSDGRVLVTAKLGCELIAGMPRVDDRCDADNSTVCVHARWFPSASADEAGAASDAGPTNDAGPPGVRVDAGTALAAADTCAHIDAVLGSVVALSSAAPISVAPLPLDIVVYSDRQDEAVYPAAHAVTIPSP